MADRDDHIMALQEAYANAYNELVKPDKVFVATQYFRLRWVPLLGPALSWVIIALRQHCYWNKSTGEKRDWCLVSQEELADEIDISVSTLKRLLRQEHADKFILDITHRYRYDPNLRKRVRNKSMYRIRMDDPLVPEDEARLKKLLAQKLSGLDVDPETGQIDILQVLDHLSETEVEDLQLKLSDRSDDQVSDADAAEIDGAISELAERLGEILIGHNSQPRGAGESGQTSDSEDDAAYPGAVFVPTAELHSFELAEDQVLLPWEEGYLAAPIAEVVKRDLRISGGYPGTRTECFYSVQHALGESPQDRPPEEQARIDRMERLEQELSQRYAYLKAFSLEEALQRYFSSDLVTQFLADKSEAEHARIAGWVAYVRRQKNLVNPAGFLRTKIESGETPPNSDVEFRNSNLEIGNPKRRPEVSPGSAEGSQTCAEPSRSIPNSQSEIRNPKPAPSAKRIEGSEISDLWGAALDELQLQMPRSTFDTWLKNTYIARIEEDRFTLACANPYAKDWLEERLDPKISKTLAGILGHPVTVEYEIASAAGSRGDDLDEDDNEA